jgi:hypothetical protein
MLASAIDLGNQARGSNHIDVGKVVAPLRHELDKNPMFSYPGVSFERKADASICWKR